MFSEILPDLLRGCTTTIFVIVLFFVLSRPKYKARLYIIGAIIGAVIDTVICCFFYLRHNYTAVLYYSLAFYSLLVIAGKFFFKDKILQWCFNCVTVLNVYAIAVISSYFLAALFPNPLYIMTVIRVILLMGTIISFYKYLRPLYMEVSENWGAFLLPTTGILAGYIYILLSLGDVEISMSGNLVCFCILTVVTVLTYFAVILSLKSLKQKYTLREENIKRKANEELLTSEIDAYDSFLNAAKQNRHDLRHHNAILAEYLNSGDVAGAKEYLKLYDDSIKVNSLKEFSKNPVANAILRLYERRCRELNINFAAYSEADTAFSSFKTDVGILLSNILENALDACKKCEFSEKHIYYSSSIQDGSLLIEINNSVSSLITFKNGLPVTTKADGGIGLLSVKKIVEKHNGMLDISQNRNEFYTRIIFAIPIENHA